MAAQRKVLEPREANPVSFHSDTWPKTLQGGDHAGDGVVKRGFIVEIGLPEADKNLKVGVPPAFVEAFADGVGRVSLPGSRTRAVKIGTNDVWLFFVGRHQ